MVLLSGCLAKEVAFAGLGLWWALDLWQHRRPAWAPGLVAVGVALGLRWVVLGVALDPEGGTMDPIGALASTGHAFADLVVPLPAGPWPVERSTGQGLVLALTVLAGSTFAAWRGRRGLLWVVGWIALAWAPMAGWLPVEVRPSRALLYLPLLGLAVGVSRVPWDRTAWLRGVGSVLVLVLVAGHGLVASRWQDPLTLWEWGVEMNPEEPLCQLNLGRARAESGDLPAAKSAYEKAAGLAMQRRDATWFVPAATALGHLALEAGDADQARIYWEDAVSIGGVAAAEAAEGLAGLE